MTREMLYSDSSHTGARPRVALLVEDNLGMRRMIAKALAQAGYLVLQAENGVEALDVVRVADRIDLVVTDVWMPEMTGDTLAQVLRRDRPAVPIIFVSGQEPESRIQAFLDNGEATFLSKPFSREALELVIQSARG